MGRVRRARSPPSPDRRSSTRSVRTLRAGVLEDRLEASKILAATAIPGTSPGGRSLHVPWHPPASSRTLAAVQTCSNCGRESPDDFIFCPNCGQALTHAPGHEVRKTVTVVFCDVTGSTAMGERLDPESLRDVQSR